jgi:hypothetical protein
MNNSSFSLDVSHCNSPHRGNYFCPKVSLGGKPGQSVIKGRIGLHMTDRRIKQRLNVSVGRFHHPGGTMRSTKLVILLTALVSLPPLSHAQTTYTIGHQPAVLAALLGSTAITCP